MGSSLEGYSFEEMQRMISSENPEKVRAVADMWKNMSDMFGDMYDSLAGGLRPLKEGAWTGEAADAFYEQADQTKWSLLAFPAYTISDKIRPIAGVIETTKTTMAELQTKFTEQMSAASTPTVKESPLSPGDKLRKAITGWSGYEITVNGKEHWHDGTESEAKDEAWRLVGEAQAEIRRNLEEEARRAMDQLVNSYNAASTGISASGLGPTANAALHFKGPLNADLAGIPVAADQERSSRQPWNGGGTTTTDPGGNENRQTTGIPDGALTENPNALNNQNGTTNNDGTDNTDGKQPTGLPDGALNNQNGNQNQTGNQNGTGDQTGNQTGNQNGTGDGTGGGTGDTTGNQTGQQQQNGLPPGALNNQTGLGTGNTNGNGPLTGIPIQGNTNNSNNGSNKNNGLPAGALNNQNPTANTANNTTANNRTANGLPDGAIKNNAAATSNAANNSTTNGGLDRNALTSRGQSTGGTGLPPGSLTSNNTTNGGGLPSGALNPNNTPGAGAGNGNPNGAPTAPPHPGSFSNPNNNALTNRSTSNPTSGTGTPTSPPTSNPQLGGRRSNPSNTPSSTAPGSRTRPPSTSPIVAGRTGPTAVTGPTMPTMPGTPTMPGSTSKNPKPTIRAPRHTPSQPTRTTTGAEPSTIPAGEPTIFPTLDPTPTPLNLAGRTHTTNTTDLTIPPPTANPTLAGRGTTPASTDSTVKRRRGTTPPASDTTENDLWTPDTKPPVLDTPRTPPTPTTDTPALGRTPTT